MHLPPKRRGCEPDNLQLFVPEPFNAYQTA